MQMSVCILNSFQLTICYSKFNVVHSCSGFEPDQRPCGAFITGLRSAQTPIFLPWPKGLVRKFICKTFTCFRIVRKNNQWKAKFKSLLLFNCTQLRINISLINYSFRITREQHAFSSNKQKLLINQVISSDCCRWRSKLNFRFC